MSIDVNARFAETRAAQMDWMAKAPERAAEATARFEARVAAGTMKNLGNGRFMVTEPGSWDNGEVFTVNLETGQMMPQHGLDLNADGSANLFLDEPAWHMLGNVRVGGLSDIGTVMELSGLDFDVELRQSRYFDHDGNLRDHPNQFTIMHSKTGDALGACGKIYVPIQNRTGFEFLQELAGTDKAKFASAAPLEGGKRVFISMKLPEDMIVNVEGAEDHVQLYVVWINNHTGNGCLEAIATPWRPACGNTERFARRDAISRWKCRHTKNAEERMKEAQRSLEMTRKYAETFTREEQALANSKYELAEFEKLAAELWPTAEEPTKRQATVTAVREEALHQIWAEETARTGRNAYTAERVVTNYLDHVAPRRVQKTMLAEAQASAALLGSDDDVKSKAHEKLMLKVK